MTTPSPILETTLGQQTQPLIEVKDIVKKFRLPGGWLSGGASYVHAVSGVSLQVQPGEVFGLVGESGCGKTTLGRIMLMLLEPTSGQVLFEGQDLTEMAGNELRQMRQKMQVVFQNPLASLSPRLKIFDVVAEPLRTHQNIDKSTLSDRVVELLNLVGLGTQHINRFPHELSGGQCQRVAIARALALHPKLIILDEPTSALDVSVQAQIINLLEDLRKEQGLTYTFISHDLAVVQHISDRIGVMYLGKLVEVASSEAIFAEPHHPYTQALLGAIPQPEVGDTDELAILSGTVPSPTDPPPGCRFHTRCPLVQSICTAEEPELIEMSPGHEVACHVVNDVHHRKP
ncbi:MAG: ABC transporter ATP-binding protein [Chloroflexi bacterium]|nr:ABC transporter ATP-binding protein [Chloroflexota bacterium]